MDKKKIYYSLAGIVIAAALFGAYIMYTGGFASAEVYSDPQGVVKTDGDAVRAAQNYNGLGFNLVKAGEDVCISPNMLASNLGLYSEGATDRGKDQAQLILGDSIGVKENHAALVHAFSAPSVDYFFSGLFMDKKVKPNQTFIDATNYYGVYFETVDFFDFVAVQNKINETASKKTDGQINSVVDNLTVNDTMIFVSALKVKEYFGNDVGKVTTTTKDFKGTQTDYYIIETAKVLYYDNGNVIYLRIPLENGYDYEVVMAKDGNLSDMTLADIKGFRDGAKETVVSVSMPVPKFEGTVQLKERLKSIEFTEAFASTTLLANVGKSADAKLDRINQTISFELIKKENSAEFDVSTNTKVDINNSYYYMFTHRETGCRTIMGKKTK